MPWLLAFLIGCRLVLLAFAPHLDPSESRYAEISRKMLETGDWITPQFDYGVPFWGKPPLAMWMSAAGMEFFGANEFGSRIFIFAAALVAMALVEWTGRKESPHHPPWMAATLLMGMPVFFYCSAAVMTDGPLLLGIVLAMTGFRRALVSDSRPWGYAAFLGIGIGLLAKGPVCLALTLPPLLGWLALTRKWRDGWQRIPWISGTLLAGVLAFPWYLAAERKTPGFLEYFLISENLHRFLENRASFSGHEHLYPPGAIWAMFVAGAFPWCLGVFSRRGGRCSPLHIAPESLYWLLWVLTPLVFFTLVRNIIATYPLPAFPALALLLVCGKSEPPSGWRKKVETSFFTITVAIVSASAGVLLFASDQAPKRSERTLVKTYETLRQPGEPLIYYSDRRYSAEFYSGGTTEIAMSAADLETALNAPGRCFVAMSASRREQLSARLKRHLLPVPLPEKGGSLLYVERTDIPDMSAVDPSRTIQIGN